MTDKKLPPEPKPRDRRMVKLDVDKVIKRVVNSKLLDNKND